MELQVAQSLNQWLPHVLLMYATKKLPIPVENVWSQSTNQKKWSKPRILNLIKLHTPAKTDMSPKKKVPFPKKGSLPTTILQGNMLVLDPET